jgi:hypothetical protein
VVPDRPDEVGDGVEVDVVESGGRVDGHGGDLLDALSIVDLLSQQFQVETALSIDDLAVLVSLVEATGEVAILAPRRASDGRRADPVDVV